MFKNYTNATTGTLLWIGILILMIGFAWWSAYAPKSLMALAVVAMGAYVIMQSTHLPYILLVVGSFFDETHISVGFALLGGGDVGIMIFLPIWFLRKWGQKQPQWHFPMAWHSLVLYYAMVSISFFLGETSQLAYGQYIRHGLYIFTFLALTDELSDYKKLQIVVWTFILCSGAHALFALLIDDPSARFKGVVEQSNLLGFLIGLGLVLAITMMHMKLSYQTKVLLVGMIIISLFSFILTVSRGSYLSLTTALLFYYRKKWRVLLFWVLLIVIVMGLLYWIDVDRFDYILRRLEFNDRSVSNRQVVIMNAIKMIQEYPFFGIGFGQFTQVAEVLQVELEAGRGSHNFYLGLCASVGLIAAYFIFSFVLWQARGLWKLTQNTLHTVSAENLNQKLLFQALQALILFHSVSLIFRGNKRMMEWVPLALYSASALYYWRRTLVVHTETNDEATSPTPSIIPLKSKI